MKRILLLLAIAGIAVADAPRATLTLHETPEHSFTVQSESARLAVRGAEAVIQDPARELSFGYRHEYHAFSVPEFDGPRPFGNGHVHATGPQAEVPLFGGDLWLWPHLRVSSNTFRERRTLEWSDVEPALRWSRAVAAPGGGELRLGIQANSRLGSYGPLPLLAWHSGERDWGSLQVGFPDSELHFILSPQWGLRLELGPDGGEWRVRDATLDGVRTFSSEGWRSGILLDWTPVDFLRLSAGVESRFGQQWTYPLTSGDTRRIDPPSTTAAQVSVRVRL